MRGDRPPEATDLIISHGCGLHLFFKIDHDDEGVCVCVMCVSSHATASLWRSEDSFWKLALSYFMWVPGIELQSQGWHGRQLYLLSYFAGLM